MSRHAGDSRIADQALIDQVRTCAKDIRRSLNPLGTGLLTFDQRADLAGQPGPESPWRLLGRALALLEQVGEM